MSGFQGYDQWKTASPYDDEPDHIEECENVAKEIKTALDEPENITPAAWRQLMLRAADTLDAAAEWMSEQ